MPTTTNFGWTTPADTDLVKDGALAIRTLGNGIDTSFLDLKGGTTGQNLRKNSNTDLDFTWAGDATNTVVDAEGDLLVGDSADTLQRLAIGTTGQVLTVDTAVDGKVKWADASAGSVTLLKTTSFSAVASVTEDNVFTSTYENYLMVVNIFPTSTSDSITLRLRASGSDTTANYTSARVGWNGSVVFGGTNNTGTDDWYPGIDGNASTSAMELMLYRPNIAGNTSFTSLGSGVGLIQFASGRQTDNTQFDGFKLAIISGTFTGNVSVYGLAK